MKRFTLLLSLCLAAAGCAGSAIRPDDAQQQEIQALKNRIVDLQREAAMNQVELAQLRQQMAEMQSRGGGAPRPPAPVTAPSVREDPVMKPATPPPVRSSGSLASATPPKSTPPKAAAPAPVVAVPPKPAPGTPGVRPATPPASTAPAPVTSAPVPQARREPVQPAEPIEEVDIELPEKGPQPPPRRAAPAVPAPAPSRPVTQPTPPAPAAENPPAASTPPAVSGAGEEGVTSEMLSPASQALYDRGYTLFHQGHFVDAEASFQRFLQANPKSELADNAQYWIGECRYSRNDVKGALAAFREVTERYPKGNKVADAMLKSGQCMEAMGDVEGARVTYREVVRRFGGSAAAAVAEERRSKLP